MMRILTYALGVLTFITLGAQVMILLERADAALLSVGQMAALLYWPDPAYASRVVDEFARGTQAATRFLALPAIILVAGPWALLMGARHWRRRRPQ